MPVFVDFCRYGARMSDHESAHPASDTTASPEPAQAQLEAAPEPEPTTAPEPAPAPAPTPVASRRAERTVAFLKTHAVTLVLAVLLVASIVWGALGVTSAAGWEERATSLSADLAGAEEQLADATATIDELETARSRAESTAKACIGAIDDADAMLEVASKLDEKTVVYLEGLNDFMAAINARELAAAETIATEIDELSVQIADLNKQVQGHIDDYGDASEGCHVDDAQNV